MFSTKTKGLYPGERTCQNKKKPGEDNSRTVKVGQKRAANHSYPLEIIALAVLMKTSCSTTFRSISKIFIILNIYYQLWHKAPSHSTVLVWIKKYGYYELSKQKKRCDGHWVIIIDESVQFGQNKLLVIYGIEKNKIRFNHPINYYDLDPLVIKSKNSWKAEDICKELLELEGQIGKVCYAIADQGNSIKKALKNQSIAHVYDITHYISLTLEHLYKHDEAFKGFTGKMAHMRKSMCLGKLSHVLPPQQRVNARFMSLRPISDWGSAVIKLLDDNDPAFVQEQEGLLWIKQYRDLIRELEHLNRVINRIQQVIKANGVCKWTVRYCLKTIMKTCKKGKLLLLKQKMKEYFQTVMDLVKDELTIACSSDIIESAFGKYKNYLQANPMVGITNLSLSIGAFTSPINNENMKMALEQVKVSDIQEWSKVNIGETTLTKRRRVLKMG